MGNPIVRLAGSYLVWSTICDAPVTFGMTREELAEWCRETNGQRGIDELAARLARVDAKGTSSLGDVSADDTIWMNRAGPGEAPLHREELIEFYVRRKKRPTSEDLAEMRASATPCAPCTYEGGAACACWGSGVRYAGGTE